MIVLAALAPACPRLRDWPAPVVSRADRNLGERKIKPIRGEAKKMATSLFAGRGGGRALLIVRTFSGAPPAPARWEHRKTGFRAKPFPSAAFAALAYINGLAPRPSKKLRRPRGLQKNREGRGIF